MEYREYTTMDRTGWPVGPWDDEPDKVQWQDDETGLPCLAVRNGMGAWCGYVGVDESHPMHGKDYDDVDVEVHGGLTFAGTCQPTTDESVGICHTPGEGEPDHVWWLGFDCAHAGDEVPDLIRHGLHSDGTYRTLDYVRSECRNLARQLAEVR